MAELGPWRQDENLPAELRGALETAVPPAPLPRDVLERVGAALGHAGVPMETALPSSPGVPIEPSWARLSATGVKLGLAGAIAVAGAWSLGRSGEPPRPEAPAAQAAPEAVLIDAPVPVITRVPPAPVPAPSPSSPSGPVAAAAPRKRPAAPRAREGAAARAAAPPSAGSDVVIGSDVAIGSDVSSGGDLAEQARLLAAARNALGSSSERAEHWLRQYDARFPKGQLQPESELIWLSSELKRGDVERARARVQKLEHAAEQPAILRRARAMLKDAVAE